MNLLDLFNGKTNKFVLAVKRRKSTGEIHMCLLYQSEQNHFFFFTYVSPHWRNIVPFLLSAAEKRQISYDEIVRIIEAVKAHHGKTSS